MRKRLISAPTKVDSAPAGDWLKLGEAAQVEVTSEADGYPVEGALLPHQERGWRAGIAGTQTIRLIFDEPQTVRTIRLVFKEEHDARTQEFSLRYLPHGMKLWKDVVRQQWNFSPPQSVEECEEYKLHLPSTAALELTITPDISRLGIRASLETMQVSVREDRQVISLGQ
jgi:hypothetical protein